jgi:uncharacterized RDD family membrane protein YckC
MPYEKSIESLTMFEEWNKEQEALKARAAIPRPPVFEPASWGKRFGAYIIDNILLGIPLGVLVFNGVTAELRSRMPYLVDPVTGQTDAGAMQELMGRMIALQVQWTLLFILVASVYYIVMHALRGQTFGKMAFDIKVVNPDYSSIGLGRAFKRALIYPIASVIPLVGSAIGLLNGLWPIWDERKQSLGDKFAKTLVVEEVEQPFGEALSGSAVL